MSDTPEKPPIVQQHDADYVVEQAVERAAVKVAAAATPTANGTEVLSKIGSIAAVGIIVIVGLCNLIVNITTQHSLTTHKHDFKAVCEIIVQQAPPETAKDLAVKLAECLK